ncbi:hypothetical protein QBC43DRAFT_190616, partial [Cladorrhinum sp. PSN259]
PDRPCEAAFCASRWFTRGWTLQELLAALSVEFFTHDRQKLGDRRSLFGTGSQQTTREEDMAYCLLGIFDIFMPLIYGEGKKSAMRRLGKAIGKN